MVHWEDRRTVETGSHAEVSLWRRVLCGVARMLCLPEFPYTACLKNFRDIGKKCVLDLNAGETVTPVKSPEGGVETVARMPFFPHCQVAVVPYETVEPVRGCTRTSGCAGNGHSPGETQDAQKFGVPPGERCVEDSGLYKAGLCGWVSDWVTSLRISPQTCMGRGIPQPLLPLPSRDPKWIVLVGFWLSCSLVWWCIMSSGRKLPPLDWAGAASTTSTPLLGTFLGLALDLASDRLYDLVDDIPDAMALWATRPSAVIVKVMSVPDSRCVRVVSPDDHVNIGFHEILTQCRPPIRPRWLKGLLFR